MDELKIVDDTQLLCSVELLKRYDIISGAQFNKLYPDNVFVIIQNVLHGEYHTTNNYSNMDTSFENAIYLHQFVVHEYVFYDGLVDQDDHEETKETKDVYVTCKNFKNKINYERLKTLSKWLILFELTGRDKDENDHICNVIKEIGIILKQSFPNWFWSYQMNPRPVIGCHFYKTDPMLKNTSIADVKLIMNIIRDTMLCDSVGGFPFIDVIHSPEYLHNMEYSMRVEKIIIPYDAKVIIDHNRFITNKVASAYS